LARPKKWRKKGAKGFPLGTPVRAQTTLRYHFAHVCAKVSRFSFCEHGFKKAALTEEVRKQECKKFFAMCYAPLFAQIFSKNGKQHLLLSIPAVRVDKI